jgi:hypothetical protein
MDRERLRRLERKVDRLAWLARLQTALLVLIAVVYVLDISSTLILTLLVIVPLVIVFHRSLPAWGRRLGWLWGLLQRQEPETRVGASRHSSSGD